MSNLKLTVTDSEDLTVLSALLQDATVLIGDMGYDEKAQQFMMVAARFIDDKSASSRRLIGINFSRVRRLLRQGFSLKDRDDVLNLLAIQANGTTIDVIFSGQARLKIECDALEIYAADLGEGWTTKFAPDHSETG